MSKSDIITLIEKLQNELKKEFSQYNKAYLKNMIISLSLKLG